MKPVYWMAGLSVLSAAVASAALGAGLELWLGMVAPLGVASGSWLVAVRTYEKHPERLTSVMTVAFLGKLVFFAAYFGVAIGILHLRPMPFAVAFTIYFIGLHLTEALCLQRLFAGRMRAA